MAKRRPPRELSALGPAALRLRDVFVTHLLASWNVKTACERSGISEREGRYLLKDPWVQEASRVAMERIRERGDLRAERVMTEAAALAGLDPGRIIDPETGDVLPLERIPEDVRRCVSSYEVSVNPKDGVRTVKVKFWDKPKALELLAKCHRLISDKPELTLNVNLADLVLEAGARVVDAPAVVTSAPPPQSLPAPSPDVMAVDTTADDVRFDDSPGVGEPAPQAVTLPPEPDTPAPPGA